MECATESENTLKTFSLFGYSMVILFFLYHGCIVHPSEHLAEIVAKYSGTVFTKINQREFSLYKMNLSDYLATFF